MAGASTRLTVVNHDRYAEGWRYVYPVVSRRAGGVSIGINLNPNDACNWRCIYCQVPGLTAGKGPAIDLSQLEQELQALLGWVLRGDFLARRAPEGARVLRDVAFSGNGGPTSSPDFAPAVELVGRLLAEEGLGGQLPIVLITNGSLVSQAGVQAALWRLGALGGQAWFKLDRGTDDGMALVNQHRVPVRRQLERLVGCASCCPTWVQTCMFALDGALPPEEELAAYLGLLAEARDMLAARGEALQGVLLYNLARPSQQPEAPRLTAAPANWLHSLGERIGQLGLAVKVSV